MVRKDCAAYMGRGRAPCSALEELECRKGECPFYKTKAQAREARRKSYERRRELGMTLTAFDDTFINQDRKAGV